MNNNYTHLLGTLIECLTFLGMDQKIPHGEKIKIAHELESHGGILAPSYKVGSKVIFQSYKIDDKGKIQAIKLVGQIEEIRFNGREFFYYVESEEVDSHGETHSAVVREDCIKLLSYKDNSTQKF